MKRILKRCAVGTLAALLFAGLFAAAAHAAGAAEVTVNGVTLNATLRYLANGSATASATKPASGGYAQFDAGTSTLTLHDAVLTQVSAVPGYPVYANAVYAGGDLNLMLEGASTITYSDNSHFGLIGVYVTGDLTVGGDGSLDVNIASSRGESTVYGLFSDLNLTVVDGVLSVSVSAPGDVYGLYALRGAAFLGGWTEINATGWTSIGIRAVFDAGRLAGGTIRVQSHATSDFASALWMNSVVLEGSDGYFAADGEGSLYGLLFYDSMFSFTGGTYIFAGQTAAMGYDVPSGTPVYNMAGGPVYVSENFDGSGKRRWVSAADGLLSTTWSTMSPFLYVQLGASPAVSQAMPETGDGARPWLWAGIALCAGLMAAGIPAAGKRRRAR